MKRWLVLLVAASLAALVLSVARAPRPMPAVRPTQLPITYLLALAIEGEQLLPAETAVPKHSLVELVLVNHGAEPAHLALGGYEQRLTIPPIAPGTTWRGRFVAELPGSDFPWLLEGKPAGRLAVTGSHLEEGHR